MMATDDAMARISPVLKGREEYQVRFLFFPKPLSSMALAMTSILSMDDTIRGNRRVAAHFSLFMRPSFSAPDLWPAGLRIFHGILSGYQEYI